MSTTHHTLGTTPIPRGMVWSDENDWVPVVKEIEYSTTGAMLVDVGVMQAGRPITLSAESDAGWIARSVLQQLRAMAADPLATYPLTLADGRTFVVMFAGAGQPITAVPVARPELPADTHPYVATVRLIEV